VITWLNLLMCLMVNGFGYILNLDPRLKLL
jgi:hypothetical protein